MMRALVVVAVVASSACAGPSRGARSAVDPLTGVDAAELYRLGVAHDQAGDSVRAEQYLAAALARGYDDAMIPLLRSCATGQRYGAALRHAQGRLALRPDDWQLRYLTAELLGAVGRSDEERDELETLVAEVSDRPEPHFALAESYARDGLNRRAAFHYGRYLALAPTGKHARSARQARARLARRAPQRSP